MALMLRGKEKGNNVELGQWANDWVTLKHSGMPVNPTSLSYTLKEKNEIEASELNNNNGMFFSWYEFIRFAKDDWRLKKVNSPRT